VLTWLCSLLLCGPTSKLVVWPCNISSQLKGSPEIRHKSTKCRKITLKLYEKTCRKREASKTSNFHFLRGTILVSYFWCRNRGLKSRIWWTTTTNFYFWSKLRSIWRASEKFRKHSHTRTWWPSHSCPIAQKMRVTKTTKDNGHKQTFILILPAASNYDTNSDFFSSVKLRTALTKLDCSLPTGSKHSFCGRSFFHINNQQAQHLFPLLVY
jgi:hypothetical protein